MWYLIRYESFKKKCGPKQINRYVYNYKSLIKNKIKKFKVILFLDEGVLFLNKEVCYFFRDKLKKKVWHINWDGGSVCYIVYLPFKFIYALITSSMLL